MNQSILSNEYSEEKKNADKKKHIGERFCKTFQSIMRLDISLGIEFA